MKNQTYAELLYCSPIGLLPIAVRTCTDSLDKLDTSLEDLELGPKDKKLICERILKQGKEYNPLNPSHESTLEHIIYTFKLKFSRGVLQELARHRIASLSVQSSRYALKKIVKKINENNYSDYLTFTGDTEVDYINIQQLQLLIKQVQNKKPNDITKFMIPDAFRTEAIFTINARSLRNLFRLRTSQRALWEFRQLAFAMFNALPKGHKILFEDRIHEKTKDIFTKS